MYVSVLSTVDPAPGLGLHHSTLNDSGIKGLAAAAHASSNTRAGALRLMLQFQTRVALGSTCTNPDEQPRRGGRLGK